jgi:hypothetical protein
MTSSLHVHSARYPDMREITVFGFAGRSSRRRKVGWLGKCSIDRLPFFIHGDSGVTKSRTTAASSIALARTSRAVMARALPSLMARSCLCDHVISVISPLRNWSLTIAHSSRLSRSQECEAHHPRPRSGSKSWCARSGEHARRFPDRC